MTRPTTDFKTNDKLIIFYGHIYARTYDCWIICVYDQVQRRMDYSAYARRYSYLQRRSMQVMGPQGFWGSGENGYLFQGA